MTDNAEQKRIAGSDGNVIVVANPGTGKTTTLAHRVMHLLERNTSPEEILCITFTRKARREMYQKITEMGAGKFDEQIKRVNIQTFHSFAYGHMVDRGIIMGKTAGDNMLRFSVFASLTGNNALNYDKGYVISEFVPKTSAAIKYVKNFGIGPGRIDVGRASEILERAYKEAKKSGRSTTYTIEETKAFLGYFVDAYQAYEDSKAESSDYTDILLKFRSNVSGPLYDHALIDEMQDMNEIQAEIAKGLAGTTFLVGDPKQAIFGFQGGSTRHLESFKSRCKTEELTVNWRSTDRILNYAKLHYLAGTDADDKSAENLRKLRSGRGADGDVPTVISTEAPLAGILGAIRENHHREIGILARTNAQVLAVSRMLDENGILHASATAKAASDTAKRHITAFLSGLLAKDDDAQARVRAIFTAFSPYTLREAFEASKAYAKARKDPDKKMRPHFEKLDELCGRDMNVIEMNGLFDRTIFPICIAQGSEWFSTARAIKLEIDEYLASEMPTAEGLFDYLAVCDESGIEQVREAPAGAGNEGESPVKPSITLSTVHKAKGREFDVVIYWPRDVDKFDFMDIIKAAILESCGTDVGGELKEEQARLHFVALTRAKNKLIIVADSKAIASFDIEGASRVVRYESTEEEEEEFAPPLLPIVESARLKEAYSLFVNDKTAESRHILDDVGGGGWLEDAIRSYFADLERLSYSAMHKKPSEFLQKNIIEIPRPSSSSEFGSRLHDAMEEVLRGGLENMDQSVQDYCREHGAERRGTWGGSSSSGDGGGAINLEETMRNGCDAISEIKKKYTDVKVYGVEKKIEVPLSAMTDHAGAEGITFAGKIDVILEHGSGYAIIDYKTDKKKNRQSDHNMQLAAYKRMFAHEYGIPEEKIDTYVVFVAIRGAVNTGRLDYEQVKSKRDAYGRFEKMLAGVLEWRDDPRGFIRDVLAEGPIHNEDRLYEAVREELANSAAGA